MIKYTAGPLNMDNCRTKFENIKKIPKRLMYFAYIHSLSRLDGYLIVFCPKHIDIRKYIGSSINCEITDFGDNFISVRCSSEDWGKSLSE